MKYLSLFLLLWVVSCKLIDTNNCYREYLFEIPFTTSPTQDTLHIGDTLWINSYFSNRLVDLNTNDTLLVDNIDFNTNCGVARIDVAPYQEASNYFRYIVTKGTIIDYSMGFDIRHLYMDEQYTFAMGIILDSVGNYNIAFGSYLIENEVELGDICEETFYNHYKMNNGANNNYYLVQQSPDTSFQSYSSSGYTTDGAYSFVVTE